MRAERRDAFNAKALRRNDAKRIQTMVARGPESRMMLIKPIAFTKNFAALRLCAFALRAWNSVSAQPDFRECGKPGFIWRSPPFHHRPYLFKRKNWLGPTNALVTVNWPARMVGEFVEAIQFVPDGEVMAFAVCN